MEKSVYVLDTVFRATGIPMQYLDENYQIIYCSQRKQKGKHFIGIEPDLLKSIASTLQPNTVPVLIDNQGLLYGVYKDHLGYHVVIGPTTDRHSSTTLCSSLCLFRFFMSGECTYDADIAANCITINETQQNKNGDFFRYMLEQMDGQTVRASYMFELDFVERIKNGDIESISEALKNEALTSLDQEHVGKLAEKPFKHYEYLAVVVIKLASSAAIEGGMDYLSSYLLSDRYLQRLEKCQSISEIIRLILEVQLTYTTHVNNLREENTHVSYVEQCKTFVARKLTQRFTLDEIAREIGLNKSYLAKRFSEEVGMGIQKYAQKKRIEMAADVLRSSQASLAEIANYFCFASQSHFGKVFKDQMGITPHRYRIRHKH